MGMVAYILYIIYHNIIYYKGEIFMKKLALVLGSLLVIGSVASAKEVMPAPVAEPEVKIVEKPVEVIVYRDRVVEAPAKWRPNGYVSVMTKTEGEIESTGEKDTDRTWEGADPRTRLELKGSVNITENQNLEVRSRDWRGLTHNNNKVIDRNEVYVQHSYDFGKLGASKVGVVAETRYTYKKVNKQALRERVNFNFADYLFSNDYIKTTNAVLAPEFTYAWTRSNDHTETYGLYADYQADIIGGVTFEAEFEDLFAHTRENVADAKDEKGNTGAVELTLNRPTTLYAAGKHKVVFEPKMVYATSWAYDKKSIENGFDGIVRENGKKERWGDYTAKFEPIVKYSYQATEYVKLMANAGAEYVNRNDARHSANHWRWQPYAELGLKVNF
ncbi:hypothetical protein HMPREF3206_01776 [Fusobacterium equinum]|uniref:Outer membrane insertion signal domain protein n=2 Tax=Fusobacterium equinum TaxID=134605 RepID=A0A133N861_9FUSO|nr:hypothetical protein HMPREF3206_01776 [Fusobacterium equinum]